MSPTWHESITLHIGSPQRGLWWVLLAVSTDRKTKTDRRGLGKLAGLVQQEALICSLVRPFFKVIYFLISLSSPFGHSVVLVPSRNNFHCPSCFPFDLQHVLARPHWPPRQRPRLSSLQYIFCRLGSTASFRKENTRRIPDLFPRLPLVK